MRDQVREKVAGEICLSEEPGKTIRKWREQFSISQQELSKHLGVSPSVISDYEAGRRRSPGIATIRKIVDAFLDIDEKTGGGILKQYSLAAKTESIISIKEFAHEVLADDLVDEDIGGEPHTRHLAGQAHTRLHGHRQRQGHHVFELIRLSQDIRLEQPEGARVHGREVRPLAHDSHQGASSQAGHSRLPEA